MLTDTILNQSVNTLEAILYTPASAGLPGSRRFASPERQALDGDDLIEPRAAAVELLPDFKRIAAALSPRDVSTQDDLVQEMCLAALDCKHANRLTYYKWLAGWRAKDYLRWWLSPMKRQVAQAPDGDASDGNETAA